MALPREVRLTHADLAHLPEDGRRYELLRGKLAVSPSATLVHQRVVSRLFRMLGAWVEERGLGEVLTAPLDVILAQDVVVQPDLLFLSAARSSELAGTWVHGAPDLVIEVLSPSTRDRDREIKRQLYGEHGVREYWLVDPDVRSITILSLEGTGYVEAASGTGDRPLSSRVLEGWTVVPARVFE